MANEKVRLNNNFIPEVIKSILHNKKILSICKQHLQYQYLHTEAQKKVVKYIFEMTDINPESTPPLGVIEQAFSSDSIKEEIRTLLVSIKKAEIQGKEDYITQSLEKFLRNAMFMKSYYEVGDLFQQGKHDKAINQYGEDAIKISNFNFRPNYYSEVFRDYDKRQTERRKTVGSKLKEKLTTGMHEIDILLRGGYSKGTAFCVLSRSGVGKSTYLRWAALANARLGKKVIYIQIEEVEEECFVKFDAGWTGTPIHDMEFGDVPEGWEEKINNTRKVIMANGGRIYVISNEEFDSLTMEDARMKILDLIKVEGLEVEDIDMILFDYLEIMSTKGGGYNKSESGERRRREEIAKKMVNIAKEFECVVGTATQAMDIKPEQVENPDFKLTRSSISEFKNAVNAFSYFFTFNATSEEYQKEIIRVYIDKLRKYHGGQTIKIYQSRKNGRFYNAKKTKEFFWDENNAAIESRKAA